MGGPQPGGPTWNAGYIWGDGPAFDLGPYGVKHFSVGPTNQAPFANTVSNIYPTTPTDYNTLNSYGVALPNSTYNFQGSWGMLIDLEGTELQAIQSATPSSEGSRTGLEWFHDHYLQVKKLFPGYHRMGYSPFAWGNDGGASWATSRTRILAGRRLFEAIDSVGPSLYNPCDQSNVVSQAPTVDQWSYEAIRAYRAEADKCTNQPLVVALLSGIMFQDSEYAEIPRAQLLSQARACIAGGAHILFFWDESAYWWSLQYTDGDVVAHQAMVLDVFREACGYSVLGFGNPGSATTSYGLSGTDAITSGGALSDSSTPSFSESIDIGSSITSSVSLPSWGTQFSSPSSSARVACPAEPVGGTLPHQNPIVLVAGDANYTTVEIDATTGLNQGIGILGNDNIDVGTLGLTGMVITSPNYCVYLGQADTLNMYNCTCLSTTGGNDYVIRGYIRIVNIGCSRLTNDTNKATLRIYGFEGGHIHDNAFSGAEVTIGGGASTASQNQLDAYGILFQDNTWDQTTIEIYAESHHLTFEREEFTVSQHLNIWDGSHDLLFNECTCNGHPLTWSDFNNGAALQGTAAARNIVILPIPT